MVLEENGERRENLKKVVREVVDIYSLARKRGIVSVRYFNTRIGKKNVTLDNEDFLSEVCYTGMSMIGTELQKKILDPFIHSIGPENSFKPLLVMIITDGEVRPELTLMEAL
jgi:hypothetical protein